MIENYITCHCYKEAKKSTFKKDEISKGQFFYTCGNKQSCNFFLKENQHYLTYNDIIDEECSIIFDLEWNKKYPLSFHMLQYEYLIPYMYGVEIAQKIHPAKELKRRSPFCFLFSNIEFSLFFIKTFENEWKLPSPLYSIDGIDLITDNNDFCRIVPSLTSWSRKTDEKVFGIVDPTKKQKQKNEYSLIQRKRIGRSFHHSEKRYKNKIEWDKFWIDLHGTEETKNGWLWNPKIKYILFEEREGYFMVRRKDVLEMIYSLNINVYKNLMWYKNKCVFDPRKAYKTPFINPCGFARYDYRLWFKKEDFTNIVKEWKYEAIGIKFKEVKIKNEIVITLPEKIISNNDINPAIKLSTGNNDSKISIGFETFNLEYKTTI